VPPSPRKNDQGLLGVKNTGSACFAGADHGLQNRWAVREPCRRWVRFPCTSVFASRVESQHFAAIRLISLKKEGYVSCHCHFASPYDPELAAAARDFAPQVRRLQPLGRNVHLSSANSVSSPPVLRHLEAVADPLVATCGGSDSFSSVCRLDRRLWNIVGQSSNPAFLTIRVI